MIECIKLLLGKCFTFAPSWFFFALVLALPQAVFAQSGSPAFTMPWLAIAPVGSLVVATRVSGTARRYAGGTRRIAALPAVGHNSLT